MEKNTLVLTDSSTIILETGGDIRSLQTLSPDWPSMAAMCGRITPANLKTVQVKDGDGLVRGNYTELVLESETSTIRPDGAILTTFHMRPKTEVERLAARLAAAEETMDVLTMETLGGGEA